MTVTLHLGDCLELMRGLPGGSVDAVITDPPYGIQHASNHGATWQRTNIAGDDSTRIRDEIVRHFDGVPMAVFGTWKVAPPKGTHSVLVWDKGPASGMGDLSIPFKPSWELIYVIGRGWHGKRDEGVVRNHTVITWETMGRKHPHEKPVSLLAYLLGKLPHDLTVIDPCMGSGSTGVACVKLGRSFIGCEIDPAYFAIAERRIREAEMQPALFQVAA